MDHLRILGLEVFGHHGVTSEEQAVGRPFSIDVEMTCDLREAGRRDDLNATVDYGALCRLVAEVNEAGPYRLLEAFAEGIAKEVLARFSVADRYRASQKTSSARRAHRAGGGSGNHAGSES